MSLWQRWRKKSAASAAATPAEPACVTALRTHIEQRRWLEARRSLDEALTTHPDWPALALLSARVLRHEGQIEQALIACDQALTSAEQPAQVHGEIAACRLAQTDFPAAIEALEVAVTLDPAFGQGWLSLGEIFLRLDRHQEALEVLHHAVEHLEEAEHKARAWYVLGQAQHVCGQAARAIEHYEACLSLQPGHLDALSALGHATLWLEDEPGALVHYEQALQRTSAPSRQLLSNMAVARQNVGNLDGARELLGRLIAANPGDYNTRWYLCQLDLLECHWKEGWANYAARFGAGASPYRPMPFKPWDGQARTDSTLLILADQGIGDEIMFASCFADAIKRNQTTLIECEPRLLNLFKRSFPDARFIATQRETTAQWLAELPTPRWQIASGDLPALFRNTDESFPKQPGYLTADPARVRHWRERLKEDLGNGLKVGISWRGGTAKTRTQARSLGPDLWAPILQVPDVQFVNLQYGAYQTELADLNSRYGQCIHDYPTAIADYDETAALVGALDLVVTVCTAIVHLSGALGTPVWILTPHVPGWRYTARHAQLAWYPNSRIFRQPQWGEWPPACQELSVALAALTISVGPSPVQM